VTQPEDVSANLLFVLLQLTVVLLTNVTQLAEFVKLIDHLVMITILVPLTPMLMELDVKTCLNVNPTTCVLFHLVTRLTELANLLIRTVMMVTHVLLTPVTQLPDNVSTLLNLALALLETPVLVTHLPDNVNSILLADPIQTVPTEEIVILQKVASLNATKC